MLSGCNTRAARVARSHQEMTQGCPGHSCYTFLTLPYNTSPGFVVAVPSKPRAEDLYRMKMFNEKVNRLRRSGFARYMSTQDTGVTISGKAGEEIRSEIRGPDEDAMDAMVLTLRFFIQDNETISLHRMAELYSALPGASQAKEYFLDARLKINAHLEAVTQPTLVYQRRSPKSGKLVHKQTLTNRKILWLAIYGGKAHLNWGEAGIFRGLHSSEVSSALVDNTFNVLAADFLDGLFYLQRMNAALYKELTGEELTIDWPEPPKQT